MDAGSGNDDLKGAARAEVAARLDGLIDLSHRIHGHPETAFAEHRSAAAVAEALDAGGFDVAEGVCALPTAFVARAGSGPMVLAICAEYDALPDVGHACGHNIIAATAVGAGLALAPMADQLGLTVLVLGTPAEEGGGGKVSMLERGAFDGVHAAMMVHPWPTERLAATCLAVSHFDVHFTGKEAHASAAPWEGVNALDAMTVSQVAVGLLRQQLRPGDQVHGVVREGGKAANIVPASITGRFMSRARSLGDLAVPEPRVRACFEAGALATGASVDFEELSPVYSHMESDPGLLAAYRANAEALGRRFGLDDEEVPPPTLSTDMANVSLAVPTIHPLIAIDSQGAVNHQPEFAAACVTASADAAVHDGSLAMAWTAIDAASNPGLRGRLLHRAG
ncbi:MAG TPA: M20 family metallopeptidase [Acidimicrobiales bacterium]|nr:M20 family metallopeptidase [Acidimicrobiales bacterium]